MRVEAIMWTGLVVFYVVVGGIYWAVNGDAAGATLLLMATGLGGLIAGWLWDWRRRHHAQPRPEDRVDADANDATGVVGVYPSASLRPLALGVGMTAIVLGVVLGSWMLLAGIAITVSQVALLTRDADR